MVDVLNITYYQSTWNAPRPIFEDIGHFTIVVGLAKE